MGPLKLHIFAPNLRHGSESMLKAIFIIRSVPSSAYQRGETNRFDSRLGYNTQSTTEVSEVCFSYVNEIQSS